MMTTTTPSAQDVIKALSRFETSSSFCSIFLTLSHSSSLCSICCHLQHLPHSVAFFINPQHLLPLSVSICCHCLSACQDRPQHRILHQSAAIVCQHAKTAHKHRILHQPAASAAIVCQHAKTAHNIAFFINLQHLSTLPMFQHVAPHAPFSLYSYYFSFRRKYFIRERERKPKGGSG
jgi:hypothetical protein